MTTMRNYTNVMHMHTHIAKRRRAYESSIPEPHGNISGEKLPKEDILQR